jgi:thiol-disulfide isomerase/thioredoxin
MRILGTIVAMVLISCISCVTKSPDRPDEGEQAVLSPGVIQLTELSGERLDLSQFEGKVIFVNIWATWCAPCIKEIPSIARAQQQLDDSKIVFLLASNESSEQIRDFVSSGLEDMHVVRLENFEELGVPAMPTTFIFDASGELAFSETGFRLWDDQASIELLSGIIGQ